MVETTTLDPEAMMARTLALCRLAKAARLTVTQARVMDAFRALTNIDWINEDDFRLALRTNLASSREEEITFDRVFHAYFRNAPDMQRYRSGIRGELMQGRLGHAYREMTEDIAVDPAQFSADDVTRNLDLSARWDPEAPPMEQVVRELARRLATRRSRRMRQARHGSRVDLRRSVRRNVRHGMDMLELARTERRVRKTRIVMLCDVSGSMDTFNPFLLQLMLGLQKELRNSRTLVFSTHVTEITSLLRRRSIDETLREIGATVRHWSGGTNIGGALAGLNRGVLSEGSPRSTVAIIISDGYDNGDSAQVAREMASLRRRVRKVVWINPMYGAATFQVRAAGMRAALPYVDYFLPAFNAPSLRVLIRGLAKI